ncbi:hypothetical protein A0V01_00980 [Borrelia hermsii]|uniref:Lipoprotein n=4 Tax=Borrelia hermsii TaxID=140 RepID=A0AAN0X4Z2_BORHE|nr:hypothetical protein BH0664 [Borrelia hermsii DAH]AJW73448.1 hypothetical protein L283_03330 [Borrelia hermsii CC1]AMR75198.1 hypothetical protein A0V01_00980 [Borrelia hermsii]ANA43462.1 hypothetical protein AXX13_03340 [Borrelia hermsii HS1]
MVSTKMLKISILNIKQLKYSIVIANLILITFISCKDKNITYDKRIKKILDNNKIEYRIDKENDFIISKTINQIKTEIIVRSKLNSYKNSKIREIFGIVEIFDVNSDKIQEISESLMSDSYNNRVLGSWEIVHDPERGNNSLVYIVKAEENAKETFLLDALDEVAATIAIFKKVITDNTTEIKINNTPNEINNDTLQNEDKIKDHAEEELQKIKAE